MHAPRAAGTIYYIASPSASRLGVYARDNKNRRSAIGTRDKIRGRDKKTKGDDTTKRDGKKEFMNKWGQRLTFKTIHRPLAVCV